MPKAPSCLGTAPRAAGEVSADSCGLAEWPGRVAECMGNGRLVNRVPLTLCHSVTVPSEARGWQLLIRGVPGQAGDRPAVEKVGCVL